MSRPRKATVALLSWNGRAHLESCLAALAEQDDPGCDWEVVVLDNGSSDGTVTWLRERYGEHGAPLGPRGGRLRVVASATNLGFCAGNNLIAQRSDADAIVLLNNDTRPQRHWLAALVEAMAAAPSDVAAVSGKIVDWEGERLDFAEGVMTFDGHAFQRGYHQPLATAPCPEDGAELLFGCGGNLLVRRDSFLRAGAFDPRYFAYLEDVDLGWRLWAGGERVIFAEQALVHHRSMATSELLGVYRRGFLFERNAFLTAYKNFDETTWSRLMPAILLTYLSRAQALLEANPGGEAFAVDPYGATAASVPAPTALAQPTWGEKWKAWGTRGLLMRGVRKARRKLAERLAPTPELPGVRIEDPRTVLHLRAHADLLRHLDAASSDRQVVQSRRRRPDREILARFPLYVVPTYPGDEKLFLSAGFRSWLPGDVPLRFASLPDLVEWE